METPLTIGTIPAARVAGAVCRPQRALLMTALVGAVLCVIVCVVMLVQHARATADDPLKSAPLRELQEKLLVSPNDQPLKEQIRTMDLQVRRRYFHNLRLNRSGAWFALGALALTLLGIKQALQGCDPLPMPQARGAASEARARALARCPRKNGTAIPARRESSASVGSPGIKSPVSSVNAVPESSDSGPHRRR